MTALTQPCATPTEEGVRRQFPVAAGANIWQGALVVLVAGGWAAQGQAATGLVAVGRARKTADNVGGANGALTVEVDKGTFRWANDPANPIAQANVGQTAYVLDDNTVSLLGTGRSIAGTIFQVDAAGVWVTTTP
jgi:hypothetical protein